MTLRAVIPYNRDAGLTLRLPSTEVDKYRSVDVDGTAAGHLASGFIPEDSHRIDISFPYFAAETIFQHSSAIMIPDSLNGRVEGGGRD